MKKLLIIVALITGVCRFNAADAQVTKVRVNISSQPVWGPVGHNYVEYYYLPSCDVYYSVLTGEFVYYSGGGWLFAPALPGMYSCDLYTTYKVVINKPRPWLHHRTYVVRYAKYKTSPPRQVIIRNSDDPKYFVVNGHPKYKDNDQEHRTVRENNAENGDKTEVIEKDNETKVIKNDEGDKVVRNDDGTAVKKDGEVRRVDNKNQSRKIRKNKNK